MEPKVLAPPLSRSVSWEIRKIQLPKIGKLGQGGSEVEINMQKVF